MNEILFFATMTNKILQWNKILTSEQELGIRCQ